MLEAIREQLLLGLLALDGVADRSREPVDVHVALRQIVLGAVLDGAHGDLVVPVSREDDDRHVGCELAQLQQRVEPLGVRQREVQDGARGAADEQLLLRARHACGVDDVELALGARPQHLGDQAGGELVVLDEQQLPAGVPGLVRARAGEQRSSRAP